MLITDRTRTELSAQLQQLEHQAKHLGKTIADHKAKLASVVQEIDLLNEVLMVSAKSAAVLCHVPARISAPVVPAAVAQEGHILARGELPRLIKDVLSAEVTMTVDAIVAAVSTRLPIVMDELPRKIRQALSAMKHRGTVESVVIDGVAYWAMTAA